MSGIAASGGSAPLAPADKPLPSAAGRAAAGLTIARLWSDKPLARTGDSIRLSAFVENHGDAASRPARLELKLDGALSTGSPEQALPPIAPGSFLRVDWQLTALHAGPSNLTVALATGPGTAAASASYSILVLDRHAAFDRRELCTDAAGIWRLLPRPASLQQGNGAPLTPVHHLSSSEIKHNTYGVCTQVPRSRDYEDPFNPSHLIDDDPNTCWSSQQNPSPYPGRPPWVEIDLGRIRSIARVNLVPFWHNSDFPLGFTIRIGRDRKSLPQLIKETDYRLSRSGPKRGDKFVQTFKLPAPVAGRFVRVEFERLPKSGGYYAEVIAGYKARLSGVEVLDDAGRNLALTGLGASVTASDTFTGWQNTPKTIRGSFRRLFDIGIKWVRVGQWGDQTEWAAVEREKGRFRMDTDTDAAIRTLLDNGVDILWTLDYGNNLYEPRDAPAIDIGPTWTEGHPFYKNGGPRTEEGRQAFVRYVDYVVRRYGNRVKWWELWNEENGWYPFFEPVLYGKLLKAVAQHVKAIDPSVNVMFGGTAAPAPLTTEISLREGAAPFIDACAFHPYGIPKPEGGMGTMEFYQGKNLSQSAEQTGWKRLEDVVEGVKRPYAQHGRPDVKVWLDEWSTGVAGLEYPYNPGIGEYGCSKYMLRFYAYSGWLNLPAAWWSLYTMNLSQDWGLIDPKDYSLRPMSFSLQNLCSVVSDVQPVLTLDYRYDGSAPSPTVIAYDKDGSQDRLILIWSADMNTEEVRSYPSRLSFKLDFRPKQVTLTDLYWGVSQPARWSYEAGTLTTEGLVVRDYPLVITCRR
jgi:hypothetical protein